MSRFAILDEIRLDPERDHQRIMVLTTCYDFPFDTTRSLEFALFRTFCVPSISSLLDRTGEFQNRSQKRYEDTDIIISELLEWGYDSERGRRAIRRMNQIHDRFQIANQDFLYVLSTFVFEPIRWIERYFNVEYERQYYRFTETNRRVGAATREMFASWFPRFLAPAVRSVIYALLDDRLILAFGFPRPSPMMRGLVPFGLRLRACAIRFLPPRRSPRLRTDMRRPIYPDGYTIEQLGPPA